MNHDILIVGGGIAGMESALTLGDMGYRVLLVEKGPSIGGKMILLSKVFPTLDCSSCISTPKMASTAHHPNVTVLPYSEIQEIVKKNDGAFTARIRRKPTFVNHETCTGCGECEAACTVTVSDPFNSDMVAYRSAHIPFPQAVPKKAVIERVGSSPCTYICPAGVKAHGYVSLVRAGKYDEAFNLHLEDAPLVASLSRACYSPCEEECTRGEFEGPVPIRAIKRFMVDRYYEEHPEPEYGPPEEILNTRIAVVGSGPAGLTAAFHLARKGHQVTVFESSAEAGGMLRHTIPTYRLPKHLLDRDIKNITALGVKIETETQITSLADLRTRGYDSIFLAVGAGVPRIMGIEGEEFLNVWDCMTFLKEAAEGKEPGIGKQVVVVGGGNVAMDVARTALRLGAKDVSAVCLEPRDKMPAHRWEIAEAEAEGVKIHPATAVHRLITMESGHLGLECKKVDHIDFTAQGQIAGYTTKSDDSLVIPVDMAVLAVLSIGLRPSTSHFKEELATNPDETIRVNRKTLQTSIPHVFAGGDAVTGPSMINAAMGQGSRAAFYIDRFLRGESLDESFDKKLPIIDKQGVTERASDITIREPSEDPELAAHERVKGFEEIRGTFTEEEARYSANRCINCGICSECHECVNTCPADSIDLDMHAREETEDVGAVIVSTGFELFDARKKNPYGFGRFPNVITGMQMDRLLAPTRPYNHVVRPSDAKAADNIAFVLCTGSRDQTVDNPLCSRVCCMYSAKHAQLIMGALPLADITIYYIDIRAFGKGYDEFYEQAKGMGVYFVRGKVGQIDELENGNLSLSYEDIAGEGGMKQAEHDLVVLSVGLLPNPESLGLFKDIRLDADEFSYIREIDEETNPGRTSIDGVFVAGAASSPRDIPDSILHAGSASALAAAYVERTRVEQ